jgi:hypothetical protein
MPAISNTPEPDGSPQSDTSSDTKTARAAALQAIREGTPDAVASAFSDLEALGDIEPDFDYDVKDREDDEDREDDLDTEQDRGEEDDPFMDGWDSDPFISPDTSLRIGADAEEPDDGLSIGSAWQIMVSDGECNLETPQWFRWRPTSKTGKVALEDLERRMRIMQRIASWLNQERKDFLHAPRPWLLGCDAWEEYQRGLASVVPGQFLELVELSELCKDSLFSRYRSATVLVWEDGTLPLDFIFGPEARMAWVANVVREGVVRTGREMESVLKEFKRTTVPRTTKQRRELSNSDPGSLDFGEFISKVNALAGTKWSDVIKMFKEQRLKELP